MMLIICLTRNMLFCYVDIKELWISHYYSQNYSKYCRHQ